MFVIKLLCPSLSLYSHNAWPEESSQRTKRTWKNWNSIAKSKARMGAHMNKQLPFLEISFYFLLLRRKVKGKPYQFPVAALPNYDKLMS